MNVADRIIFLTLNCWLKRLDFLEINSQDCKVLFYVGIMWLHSLMLHLCGYKEETWSTQHMGWLIVLGLQRPYEILRDTAHYQFQIVNEQFMLLLCGYTLIKAYTLTKMLLIDQF